MPAWRASTAPDLVGSITKQQVSGPNRMGCAARSRLLAVAGLFRAAFLRTRLAPFNAPGSPVTYAACATGLAWMYSWQGAQTPRVLRRIRAMCAAHAGR